MLRIFLILLSISPLLGACSTSWPAEGSGGQAEDYALKEHVLSEVRIKNISRLKCFHGELQYLSADQAGQLFPAKIKILSELWNRARRAHGGHLDLEASIDLNALSSSYEEFRLMLDETKPISQKNISMNININFLIKSASSNKGACS